MRVAVFIKSTTFHKTSGGLETQNKTLCEGLAEKGHDVTIFSPKKELKEEKVIESNVKYVFIKCTYRMLFASLDPNNWYRKSYTFFLNEHKKKPFDVVISQSSAGIGIIAGRRKEKIDIGIVGISHGTIGGEIRTILNSSKRGGSIIRSIPHLAYGTLNYMTRQKSYINGCDRVVAVSHAVKRAIQSETGCTDDKITVIHNGIDPSKVLRKVWNGNEPIRLIYTGRIEESKGLIELISALVRLPDIFLNVVGEGPLLEILKKQSRDNKMSKRVFFYGRLPHEKVLEMYACSDIFILPSKRLEGLPMTLVEASFCGIPIIATDIGGNSDIVKDGYNGLLIPNPNPDTIISAVKTLTGSRKSMENMGHNGRINAESNFTVEKMLERYEKICTF